MGAAPRLGSPGRALAEERHVASVAPDDGVAEPGTRQDFLYTALGWTQAHGVFRIAVAQESVWYEAQVERAQAEIADLRKQLADAQAQAQAGTGQGQAGAGAGAEEESAAMAAVAAIKAIAQALAAMDIGVGAGAGK